MNRFQRLPALLVLLAAFPASASASGDRPDLDYFQVRAIPLEGHDAPAISNNWLWAQAANGHARGILNMEDVRPGGRPQFHGTTIVRVGGQPLVADPRTADWWPNKVLRRAKVDGIEYTGIVAAAAEKYALLSRLTAANTTAQPKTISLEVELIANEGLHGTVEEPYHDEANARQLAEALIQHLYNDQGNHGGTWKQRHQDGSMLEIRHSWDFMNAGSYLAEDLSLEQKRQMRDWFVDNLVRFGSDDVWVVAQDPRDGNNGPHQMEHNGRGAYPAWPYHDGWALKAMGFHQDVIDLLRVIDGIPRMGAIGQGYHPGGGRCRSNWVSASGTTAAAFLTRNVFGVAPGLGEFRPNVKLGDFDPDARLEDVPVKGTLFQVSREGAVATGRLPQ